MTNEMMRQLAARIYEYQHQCKEPEEKELDVSVETVEELLAEVAYHRDCSTELLNKASEHTEEAQELMEIIEEMIEILEEDLDDEEDFEDFEDEEDDSEVTVYCCECPYCADFFNKNRR